MKYLIIGLGNPGNEYKDTRHNIGFKILDELAFQQNTSFVLDRHVFLADCKYKSRRLILVKPNTFMNLSGKAVYYWLKKLKLDISNILVVTDDIALPLGVLRIKPKGSDGGHNGLKNINNTLLTNAYPRLRFGIGSSFNRGIQAEYVLNDFKEEERDIVTKSINTSVEINKSFSTINIERTMNLFN